MKFNLLSIAALVAAAASSVSSEVYFEETFTDPKSIDSWVKSEAKENIGAIKLSTGEWFSDKENSVGLQLSEDARFYDYAAHLKKPFNTEGKDLILQFSVKYEQIIDCGGAYLKLLPVGSDLKKFDGETPYTIMFGPDFCGSDVKIHAILNYNSTNHQIKKTSPPIRDEYSHLYTLWLKADKTFEIRLDNKTIKNGTVEEHWPVLAPKEIPDLSEKKPKDWVDEPTMNDPEDKKPEGYDDIPEEIIDPSAEKPKDWDDDMDGDWEAPMIPNPEYKGKWAPKKIPNPEYKGEWAPKNIPNPEYKHDDSLAVYNIGAVGIDVWTVKSGTILDNILITDDIKYAEEFAKKTYTDFVQKELDEKKLLDEKLKAKFDKLKKEKDEKEAAKKDTKDGVDEEDEDEEDKEDLDEELEEDKEDADEKLVKKESKKDTKKEVEKESKNDDEEKKVKKETEKEEKVEEEKETKKASKKAKKDGEEKKVKKETEKEEKVEEEKETKKASKKVKKGSKEEADKEEKDEL